MYQSWSHLLTAPRHAEHKIIYGIDNKPSGRKVYTEDVGVFPPLRSVFFSAYLRRFTKTTMPTMTITTIAATTITAGLIVYFSFRVVVVLFGKQTICFFADVINLVILSINQRRYFIRLFLADTDIAEIRDYPADKTGNCQNNH